MTAEIIWLCHLSGQNPPREGTGYNHVGPLLGTSTMWAHAGHLYLTILLCEPIRNIYMAWAQANEPLKWSILTTIQYIAKKGLQS